MFVFCFTLFFLFCFVFFNHTGDWSGWPITINTTSTIYVTSDGSDFEYCGTESCPCGTIWYVTTNILNQRRYNNFETLTIDIRGVNFDEIVWGNAYKCRFGTIPLSVSSNLIYYFNPDYIYTASDWLNPYICTSDKGLWVGNDADAFLFSSEGINDDYIPYLSGYVEIQNLMFTNIDLYHLVVNNTNYYYRHQYDSDSWHPWFFVKFWMIWMSLCVCFCACVQ